jgi:predicted nucleotidyltransferase component of viral defense system
MISRGDVQQRVTEWGLSEEVIEKDYVLGWLLWGIGTDPVLADAWIFKGGTCLKKCWLETYRFSEDLDFTVLPGGAVQEDDVVRALRSLLIRVGEASGIDFAVRDPVVRMRPSGQSAEVRVYYRGPRMSRQATSVKFDLSAEERVVRPHVLRSISHPYPDSFPTEEGVRCYSFEELFAEKIRAMGERGLSRDLYDIVNLYRRHDLRLYPDAVRAALVDKCEAKGVPVPTLTSLDDASRRPQLESQWANMLGHQLQKLPPVEQFLGELPHLFGWLDGSVAITELPQIPFGHDEIESWSPPETIYVWGQGVPFETVRFAASNYLCVDLGYQGTVRTIEPYSLRRTQAGFLILHAIKADTREHRSYRVDKMQSLASTTRPFQPVYVVELATSRPLYAPPAGRGTRVRASAPMRRRRRR